MRWLIICLLIFLILCPVVSAGVIGISPASYKINFEPNLKKTFSFRASTSDPNQKIGIYVKGDLAEYVNLSKTSLLGGGSFDVTLSLPKSFEKPGKHVALIGVIEMDKEIESATSMIGGVAAVQAPIEVFVPYPGKYAEAEFMMEDINEGEFAFFELKIKNLGTDDFKVIPKIEFYDNEEEIKTEILNDTLIKSQEEKVFNGFIDTSDFSPGVYNVIVKIDYGQYLEIKDEFKIGTFFINITDYSNEFKPGKINKFYIEIESLWNSRIENVYSEVSVTDQGEIIDQFKTPSADIEPWQKINLTGFFNAEEIEEGKYRANLRVNYQNKTTYKLVVVYVQEPSEINYLLIAVIGGVILFLMTMSIIIYLIIRIRRLNKKIKRKQSKIK